MIIPPLPLIGASKDELLTMIQHGAEKIFKESDNDTEDATLDDIDEILRHGEEKTAELNKKYENYNIDDLKNFSSESAYKWNGQDWSNKVRKKMCVCVCVLLW
jgi:SWI/SNF-related matrix-associated actin-dependent regulator of chromatin subfamily A member 5